MAGNGVKNYDPLVSWDPNHTGSGITLSNNNLSMSATTGNVLTRCTVGKTAGKWYWEILITGTSTVYNIGFGNSSASVNNYPGAGVNSFGYVNFITVANKVTNATPVAYGSTYATGDIIGVALDMSSTGQVTMFKNNVSQGVIFSGLGTATALYPMVGTYLSNGAAYTANFGNTPFAFTPPTGFIALTYP